MGYFKVFSGTKNIMHFNVLTERKNNYVALIKYITNRMQSAHNLFDSLKPSYTLKYLSQYDVNDVFRL